MSDEEQCSRTEQEPSSDTENFDGFDESVFNLRHNVE